MSQSKIKSVQLNFQGATLRRDPIRAERRGDLVVVRGGAEVALDLVTRGAGNQDVGEKAVLEEGRQYQTKFVVEFNGVTGEVEFFGGTMPVYEGEGRHRHLKQGTGPFPGYVLQAPDGISIGDSRPIFTLGHSIIANHQGNAGVMRVKAFLKMDGTEVLESNTVEVEFEGEAE